jgi:O-antigen/teichoic acid export membrane protein
MTSGLRGLLEAHQHFGIATALRVPYAMFAFVGPLLVLPWSHSLVVVIGVLLIGRVVLWAAHLIVCARRYPFLRGTRLSSPRAVVSLIVTGGWMTVSNIISPLMVVADRFLIGAMFPIAVIAYYVTPFEMVFRVLIIPGAVLAVFFPAYADAHAHAPARASELFGGSLRVLLFLMFPIILVMTVLAPEILHVWVGADYAARSAGIMRWLAIGVFINSLAQVPFTALQALDRADLTAKLHVIELPLYVAAIFGLGRLFGVVGVAMAWTFRIILDTALLFWLARDRVPEARSVMLGPLLALVGMTGAITALSLLHDGFGRLAAVLLALLFFATMAWRHGLRPSERDGLLRLIPRGRAQAAPIN